MNKVEFTSHVCSVTELKPLDHMDDDKLIRMPKQCIVDLADLLGNDLQRSSIRSNALSVSTQVLVALKFFATGSMQ